MHVCGYLGCLFLGGFFSGVEDPFPLPCGTTNDTLAIHLQLAACCLLVIVFVLFVVLFPLQQNPRTVVD